MSFQHHNEKMSPELRKLFENEQAARDRFSEQVAGRAKRTWSDGRHGRLECSILLASVTAKHRSLLFSRTLKMNFPRATIAAGCHIKSKKTRGANQGNELQEWNLSDRLIAT